MKNTIKTILIVTLSVFYLFTNAQNEVMPPLDSIKYKFHTQLSKFPQEKIYAQIDKPYYITGENIWFRAHLVNAGSNLPDTTSRYIYAELINPIDSVIDRVKVRPQNGAYSGFFSLDEELPEGEYLLRFYTRFQEGLGDDYFFKRTVRIGDPLSAIYRTEATFQYEDNKKKVKTEIRFVDVDTDSIIKPENIRIKGNSGTKVVNLDKDNVLRMTNRTPTGKENRIILLEYDYLDKFHKQFIQIQGPEDYEVTFMPEGGDIPLGKRCKVAFKALNSFGLAEEISGVVVSEKGDTINDFQSQHRGMGFFLFQSDHEMDKYYVICKNAKGIEKRYLLPSAISNSVALQVQQQTERTYISVNKSIDMEADTSLYLVIQCRGVVLSASKWDDTKEFLTLPKDILPSGVIQVLLVDHDMNPISERLFFNVNTDNFANVTFSTDKKNYDRREKVNLSFGLSDTESKPSLADFSISITDDADVKPDTCINILSSLLLTSELKGYIESPAYYFANINYKTKANLDFLMMTQGWSRYDVAKILKGDYERPEAYLELGPAISGTVKGGLLMNRPSANYPVSLFSLDGSIFDQTVTDDKGHFIFNYAEVPDSVRYVVQALTKKGGNRVELILDSESFPIGKFTVPYTFTQNNNQFENYIEKADKQFISTNGMRMMYLDGVEITTKKIEPFRKSTYSSSFNPKFTLDEINKFHASDVLQVLMRFGGVVVSGNNVSIRGGGTPLVLVDDIPYDAEFLSMIPIDDVAEIEVIKDGSAAILGSNASNGAILISTKTGELNAEIKPFNIKGMTPLGYQVSKEFYSPQYETQQQKDSAKPDLRSTIYWNPSVKTSEEGVGNLSFYTSDTSTTYSVVMEGVTTDGLLIHSVEKIHTLDDNK